MVFPTSYVDIIVKHTTWFIFFLSPHQCCNEYTVSQPCLILPTIKLDHTAWQSHVGAFVLTGFVAESSHREPELCDCCCSGGPAYNQENIIWTQHGEVLVIPDSTNPSVHWSVFNVAFLDLNHVVKHGKLYRTICAVKEPCVHLGCQGY